MTLSKLKISETPIEISNIIIEPSNTAQKFLVYGRTTTTTSDSKGVIKTRKGILIGVDFSSLHERTCTLPDKPDDSSSDYETWTPSAYLSDSCLMGHKITYSRRKRDAECFNPQEFDKVFNYKNCLCTEEDWECDLGYERKKNGPCVLTRGSEPSYEPPEECYGFYTISSGYRKVAGNTCGGGVDHSAIKFPCPSRIFTKRNSTFLLGIALAGLVIWVVLKKGDGLLEIFKRNVSRGKSTSRKDFAQLGQEEIANANDEEDDDFAGRLHFVDDGNDRSAELKSKSGAAEKRMTERKGLETAMKSIPAVNKPQGSQEQKPQQHLLD